MKYLLLGLMFVALLVIVVGGTVYQMVPSNGQMRYKVELHSGGQVVKTWETDDNVPYHLRHGFARFTDKATGKYICVSGDVVVTPLD